MIRAGIQCDAGTRSGDTAEDTLSTSRVRQSGILGSVWAKAEWLSHSTGPPDAVHRECRGRR
jgi:hypothetical protein